LICYIITNPAWDNWIKVGFTSKSEMKTRLSTYQTGTPFRDYEVYFTCNFENAKLAEVELMNRLIAMNCQRKHEWFKMSAKIAANIIESIKEEIDSGLLENIKKEF
jgi:predicted small metal-binding protein